MSAFMCAWDEIASRSHSSDCSKTASQKNEQKQEISKSELGSGDVGDAIVLNSVGPHGLRGGLGAHSSRRDPRRIDDLLLSAHPHLPDSAIFRRRLQAPRATFCDRGEHRAFVLDLPPADFLPRTWNSGPARGRPSICSWCVLPRATTATSSTHPKASSAPSTSFSIPNAAPCHHQRPQFARVF